MFQLLIRHNSKKYKNKSLLIFHLLADIDSAFTIKMWLNFLSFVLASSLVYVRIVPIERSAQTMRAKSRIKDEPIDRYDHFYNFTS